MLLKQMILIFCLAFLPLNSTVATVYVPSSHTNFSFKASSHAVANIDIEETENEDSESLDAHPSLGLNPLASIFSYHSTSRFFFAPHRAPKASFDFLSNLFLRGPPAIS